MPGLPCDSRVAVIIPSYKVTAHVLGVIRQIDPVCSRIYVVDDCCPEGTGEFVRQHCNDPRAVVLSHEVNQGVGGAVMSGYRAALDEGMDILVKVDGDGQMDPRLIHEFIAPIQAGEADYTKGNRFFNLEVIRVMPKLRLLGNAVLSFMSKLSSGYWDIFDPTNGYTAIHCDVARRLPFTKISSRYFFETDMLFRLNTLRAVVIDVPMDARYGDEISNLSISKIIGEFLFKHSRNLLKRIFYNYYLRGMSLASLELPLGILMMSFGILFGGIHWVASVRSGVPAPAGTVMLAALSALIGLQFVLAFLAYDISSIPRRVLQLRSAYAAHRQSAPYA